MTETLFAIYAIDHPDSLEKRSPLRADHIARLALLHENGKLVLAGPLLDHAGKVLGSLIIAKFSDLLTAQTWFGQDPYVQNNIYHSIEIKAFNPLLLQK